MGPGIISLFFSIGASTWLYAKLQRSSGNNTKQSAIATAIAGLVMFFVLFSILTLIF
jgi:hypothetical protein